MRAGTRRWRLERSSFRFRSRSTAPWPGACGSATLSWAEFDRRTEQDRLEIVNVHLVRSGKVPSAFDLVSLSKATPGFNGAELEQLVLSAMYTAFDQKRDVTMNDMYRNLARIVPLSTTMSERIKEIKRWADTRAVKASG